MVEYHRSPGLRKRIHPKPDAINVGFAEEALVRSPTRTASPSGRSRGLSRGSSVESDCTGGRTRPSPKKQLSDLDIQIAHSPLLGLPAEPPAPAPPRALYPVEKPSRYGKLISHTVDTWARRAVQARDGAYKPLVFGGTYPIDVPASPPDASERTAHARGLPVAEVKATVDRDAHRRELRKTIERSLDKFEAILAKRDTTKDARRRAFSKRTVNTFDIDEPMNATEAPREAIVRNKDTKYYVSGPKTFNIDEPVSFI